MKSKILHIISTSFKCFVVFQEYFQGKGGEAFQVYSISRISILCSRRSLRFPVELLMQHPSSSSWQKLYSSGKLSMCSPCKDPHAVLHRISHQKKRNSIRFSITCPCNATRSVFSHLTIFKPISC